jgi:oxygen-dependent protoporphyrinogen oxidase
MTTVAESGIVTTGRGSAAAVLACPDPDPGAPSVAVLGGGITGLATAWRLLQARDGGSPGLQVTVIEAAPRMGGKITTEHRDGFVLEAGPDSFLTRKPEALELVRELGLGPRLLPTRPGPAGVLLLRRGRLRPLPAGQALLVPTRLGPLLSSPVLSLPGRLRVALDLLLPPRRGTGDESVGAFLRRRLGREMAERVAGPLLAGIHGTDPEELSLLSAFPQFADLERRHGSLIRGLRALDAGRAPSVTSGRMTLAGGLGELVAALTRAVERSGARLWAGRPAASCAPRNGGGFCLTLADGGALDADAVVLALPPPAAARLVEGSWPRLAGELRQIPCVTSATVSLGFARSAVSHPLDAYGFVAPPGQGRRITACTFTSSKFPHRAPPGAVLLRAFVGGPGADDLATASDSDLVDLVIAELSALLGITGAPRTAAVHRFPQGSAQYRVGHGERLSRLEALLPPGLMLAGSGFHGVGIPDCLKSAAAAARTLRRNLRSRPPHLLRSIP